MLEVAKDIQDFINNSMNHFAEKCLNVKNHRFNMKQELVAKRGFWTTKKRYGLKVVNSEGFAVNKIETKGLDSVRTSFPKVFKEFMEGVLKDILNDVETINKNILDLKKNIKTTSISHISRPTSIKEISKYTDNKHAPFTLKFNGSGTPVHVKAAINYNDFIRYYKMENKYGFENFFKMCYHLH
jgi:DNA polymerase elongation subunit (family B)